MEADKNPIPPLDLFPRISKITHFIFDHLRHEGLSDHGHGGGPALDAALYDQDTLPFPQPTGKVWVPEWAVKVRENRWDDQGRDVPEGF